MITAVILAAGAARRMGTAKQLLPVAGHPMIWWAASVACASAVDDVLVVTGEHHKAIAKAVEDLPVRLVHNPCWVEGQAASIRAGVAAITRPSVKAAIFMLADQPLLTSNAVNKIIAAYHTGKGSIVVPICLEKRRNPVIFDLARWRQPLMALSGDQGGRQLILEHSDEVTSVNFTDEKMFLDVDTPDDYKYILEKMG